MEVEDEQTLSSRRHVGREQEQDSISGGYDMDMKLIVTHECIHGETVASCELFEAEAV